MTFGSIRSRYARLRSPRYLRKQHRDYGLTNTWKRRMGRWCSTMPASWGPTATPLLSFCDMACSLSLAPLASFSRWWGWNTAGHPIRGISGSGGIELDERCRVKVNFLLKSMLVVSAPASSAG
jgi:hypothetical protein